MMRVGFFDDERQRVALSAKSDPLEAIAGWFRGRVAAHLPS